MNTNMDIWELDKIGVTYMLFIPINSVLRLGTLAIYTVCRVHRMGGVLPKLLTVTTSVFININLFKSVHSSK